jgi:CRISPR system Cascade subunit CasA
MMHNLLLDPIIRVRLHDGTDRLSLPEVYVALAADRVADFPALRAHQRHAWHALLCQLGALACLRAGLSAPPRDAEAWRAALRQLAPEHPDDAAFTLVTPPDRPGFLQAPISQSRVAELTSDWTTPDDADALVIARNHDLKLGQVADGEPEDWVFAMVTGQTMSGASAAGKAARYWPISRMNSESGNRPAVSLRPPGGYGAHVMRDVRRLCALRDEALRHPAGFSESGIALVWLCPWDGTTTLRPNQLDPYYIEVCRSVRLSVHENRIVGRVAGTEAARIDFSKEARGLTGDPWTPVEIDGETVKALTIQSSGFTFRRLANILARRGFELAPLHRVGVEESEHTAFLLVCRALARGQGKTEGLHERRIPVPPRAIDFWRSGETALLADITEQRIKEAEQVLEALSYALAMLFQNGPDRAGFQPPAPRSKKKSRATPFLDRLESRIDDDFFRHLFTELEAEHDAERTRLRAAWLTLLLDRARNILHEAEKGAPSSAVRRFRAQARAEAALSYKFFAMFKDYFPKETSDAA